MSRYRVDIEALAKFDRQMLIELDEQIERNIQRDIEHKRREEEKSKKKKAKRKRAR